MKDIILLYDDCCIYEIVILNYFLKFTNSEMLFCSVDGQAIQAMEGYSIKCNISLKEVDLSSVRSLIVPGGNIKNIDKKEIFETIVKLNDKKVLIAGICAGVDILDKAGILKNIPSTHSVDADCVSNGNIVTARANAYVDFAIEVGKALELFEDDADLKETIEFWKHHKRVQ
jgi:putative intracellular protease/amidase